MNTPPTVPGLSRRDLLRCAGLGGLPLAWLGSAATRGAGVREASPAAAAAGGVAASLAPFNRFGRMMQDHYVRRLRALEPDRQSRLAALRTKADAEAYLRDVRGRISQVWGPMPERTPLRAQVTGVIKRDGYRVEKVIFESRPGFPVTANLYVPANRGGPGPAVVVACGHNAEGKAHPRYQSAGQGLAGQGYVALVFDPLGQGERVQNLSADGKPRHGVSSAEHLYEGARMSLVGEFFGSWCTWDGSRALDYLLTRPEVDPHAIGVTGCSGGGTQTTWLCGFEPRFAMAAPSCFIATFRRNLENEVSSDSEQCPPRALALGIEQDDFIAAFAPKPVILLGQELDAFDVRGLEEAYARLQRIYRLLGAGENLRLFVGPEYHGFTQSQREAMYQWFNHATGRGGTGRESEVRLEEESALWCTPRGQVGAGQARTIHSFVRDLSRALGAQRTGTRRGDTLPGTIRNALGLRAGEGVPDYRILRTSPKRGYAKPFAATYAVETEPEVFAIVYRLADRWLPSRPPRAGSKALLYVAHHSADAELRDDPWLAELIRSERQLPIFACDVRGIGESAPNTGREDAADGYNADYFYASHGIMFGVPYVAQRVHDLLRVLEWLASLGHSDVHLVAKGQGTLPATLAAVLAETATQVTLKHALSSFAALVEAEDYTCPLSSMLPGVLRSFDLPDCYQALAAKRLRQVEPWVP